MKKLILLLILSVSGQVSFASVTENEVITYQQQEPYNTQRFDEFSKAYKEFLDLKGAQISAANANIIRYLKDKEILDKSVNGLTQNEYNYRLEKIKIELTYKLKVTLNDTQLNKLELITKLNETPTIRTVKQMLFI